MQYNLSASTTSPKAVPNRSARVQSKYSCADHATTPPTPAEKTTAPALGEFQMYVIGPSSMARDMLPRWSMRRNLLVERAMAPGFLLPRDHRGAYNSSTLLSPAAPCAPPSLASSKSGPALKGVLLQLARSS